MIKKLLISLTIIVFGSAFYRHSTISEGSLINSVHFSPDASMVVLASNSNTHNIYYFPTMKLAYAYTASGQSTCAKFSPNQLYVAFAVYARVFIKNTNDFSTISNIITNLTIIN